jgi:hypothetical protein
MLINVISVCKEIQSKFVKKFKFNSFRNLDSICSEILIHVVKKFYRNVMCLCLHHNYFINIDTMHSKPITPILIWTL